MTERAPGTAGDGGAEGRPGWTFLTNHMHVLLCISRDPTVRLRDVATLVGITERAAQSIVADLVQTGYLSRLRVGRRNQYEVHDHMPLRHPLESDYSVSDLLDFLATPASSGRARRSSRH